MKSRKNPREDDPRYSPVFHNTWKLLRRYRDVVWSLETSVQQVRNTFCIEYGSSIEEFLDSIYLAGVDLSGTDIEHHAKSIERSHKMLQLVQSSVDLMRTKHKNGERYYWILYYTFLSPQDCGNVLEIMEQLRPHMHDVSYRTYYRQRDMAVETLSSVLWGYTSRENIEVLDLFFPENGDANKCK